MSNPEKFPMNELPADMILEIATHLSPKDLFHFIQTNKNINAVLDNAFWVYFYKKYFAYLHSGRDKNFGNARTVRQVCGESVKNQNLRLASMKKENGACHRF